MCRRRAQTAAGFQNGCLPVSPRGRGAPVSLPMRAGLEQPVSVPLRHVPLPGDDRVAGGHAHELGDVDPVLIAAHGARIHLQGGEGVARVLVHLQQRVQELGRQIGDEQPRI